MILIYFPSFFLNIQDSNAHCVCFVHRGTEIRYLRFASLAEIDLHSALLCVLIAGSV